MQAIQTTYYGPTNMRGARIKVECATKTRWLDWDYSLDPEANHIAARNTVVAELDWRGPLVCGVLKDGSYVHVFTTK